VLTTTEGGMLLVTSNRPEARNAMTRLAADTIAAELAGQISGA
jgi:enoyl-CoA hydratase/carnithine racemase